MQKLPCQDVSIHCAVKDRSEVNGEGADMDDNVEILRKVGSQGRSSYLY